MAVVNYSQRPDTPNPAICAVTIWSRGNLSRRPVRAQLGAVASFPRQTAATRMSSASLICRKPLLFNASTKTKAFVAPGRDLVAFLLVRGDAADIRHEHTGFPRNVCADVP